MKEEGEVHRNKKESAPASPEDCPSGRDERPEIKEEKMAIDGAIFFRRWLQRETFFFLVGGSSRSPSERIHQSEKSIKRVPGSMLNSRQGGGWPQPKIRQNVISSRRFSQDEDCGRTQTQAKAFRLLKFGLIAINCLFSGWPRLGN